jgi:hypothetical protein
VKVKPLRGVGTAGHAAYVQPKGGQPDGHLVPARQAAPGAARHAEGQDWPHLRGRRLDRAMQPALPGLPVPLSPRGAGLLAQQDRHSRPAL